MIRKYYSEEGNSITTFTDTYAIVGGKKYVRKECSKPLNDTLDRLEGHLKKNAIELFE